MQAKNYKSIPETIEHAIEMGYQMAEDAKPIQSDLKRMTSLIGMAYLNYIYQNDLENEHFCKSMLLMNSQVPAGTDNPYVHLFDSDMANKTMTILQDIQLSFDYSIARSNPPTEKVLASIATIQAALREKFPNIEF